MSVLNNSETTQLTTSSAAQLHNREKLWEMFKNSSLSEAELERSLGLFIRSSLLARFLAVSEVYKTITSIPGSIFDLGTWRGQTAVLFENLRSIYEPFNKQRRIICFDTFSGYTPPSENDSASKNYHAHTYSTGSDYVSFLKELLLLHEKNNVLEQVNERHQVIAGDASYTVKEYFLKNPQTIVALASFDLGLYEPTKAVLENLIPHLISGSRLLFMQLTRDELPGDAIAFKEVFKDIHYEIEKVALYPSFNLVKIL